MALLKIFKSTIPSVNYIFGNGKAASFINGVYRTDVDWEVAALEYEVKMGHPQIYIDEAEKEIESELLDPMVALKERFREEILREEAAKLAAATDPNRDMGNSAALPLKPASTADIQEAAEGGSGAQLAARLTTMKVK